MLNLFVRKKEITHECDLTDTQRKLVLSLLNTGPFYASAIDTEIIFLEYEGKYKVYAYSDTVSRWLEHML